MTCGLLCSPYKMYAYIMVCTDSAMTIKDAANMMQNMNCD